MQPLPVRIKITTSEFLEILEIQINLEITQGRTIHLNLVFRNVLECPA